MAIGDYDIVIEDFVQDDDDKQKLRLLHSNDHNKNFISG